MPLRRSIFSLESKLLFKDRLRFLTCQISLDSILFKYGKSNKCRESVA